MRTGPVMTLRLAMFAMLAATVTANASAEESRVVQGCLAVIHYKLGPVDDKISRIDDFSEMDPPRAQVVFTVGARSESIRCEFENRESPLSLTEVCVMGSCTRSTDTGDARKRFDEIAYVLEQQGF